MFYQVNFQSQNEAGLHKHGKRQLFSSSYMTQAAGVTHDREQGEGKQIYSESLVNKRNPAWSSALLHSWKQK